MKPSDVPQPAYGSARLCPHCSTRVAQKADTCFYCGEALTPVRERRWALPWADIILFAVIGAVVALWWTRAPEAPDGQRISLAGQGVARAAATAAQPAVADILAEEAPTPTPTPLTTPTPRPTITPTPTAVRSAPFKHAVKPGETLIQIAANYEVTIGDIASANGINAGGILRIGQELIIPIGGPSGGPGPTPTSEGGALMYVVKAGDTISTIAERYDSQIGWILQANNMQPGDILHIGRALLVPLSASTPTPTVTPENTPTPTPTSGPRLPAPRLLAPASGAVIVGNEPVLLTWAAPGTLAEDEWYVVTVKAIEVNLPIPPHWTKATSWRLEGDHRADSGAPTEFTWQVQVRKGSETDPGEPASAPSVTRGFTWR